MQNSILGGIKMISQLILLLLLIILISIILFALRIILEIYQYKKIYFVIIKLQNMIEFLIDIKFESKEEIALACNGYTITFKNYKELLKKYEFLIVNMLNYYEDYEEILRFHEGIPIYHQQILNIYNEIRVLKWSLKND